MLKQTAAAGVAPFAPVNAVAATARGRYPDLGPNVTIVDPTMPASVLQARLDAIVHAQERAHFTDARHAALFLPGRYAAEGNIGFFTQVAGLGTLPGDVTIDGQIQTRHPHRPSNS